MRMQLVILPGDILVSLMLGGFTFSLLFAGLARVVLPGFKGRILSSYIIYYCITSTIFCLPLFLLLRIYSPTDPNIGWLLSAMFAQLGYALTWIVGLVTVATVFGGPSTGATVTSIFSSWVILIAFCMAIIFVAAAMLRHAPMLIDAVGKLTLPLLYATIPQTAFKSVFGRSDMEEEGMAPRATVMLMYATVLVLIILLPIIVNTFHAIYILNYDVFVVAGILLGSGIVGLLVLTSSMLALIVLLIEGISMGLFKAEERTLSEGRSRRTKSSVQTDDHARRRLEEIERERESYEEENILLDSHGSTEST